VAHLRLQCAIGTNIIFVAAIGASLPSFIARRLPATRKPVDGISVVRRLANTRLRAKNFAGTKTIASFRRARGVGSVASADLAISMEKSIEL
jgi:hypothetical protein